MSTERRDGKETVYVRSTCSGSVKTLHTDRECPYLSRAKHVYAHPRSHYPPDRKVCKRCSGDVKRRSRNSNLSTRLRKMDPDDL